MHVLIAGTGGTLQYVDRGLEWACRGGALKSDVLSSPRCVVGVARSSDHIVNLSRLSNGIVGSLGLGKPSVGELASGAVRNGTISIEDSAAGTFVGVGAGNQRLFKVAIGGEVLVSSHVGALVAACGGNFSVDRSFEDFMLGFGFYPDGRTVFDGIEALSRPGIYELSTLAVVPMSEDQTSSETATTRSDMPIIDLLVDIVDEQAGEAKSVGVLLGGFDSALVAAAANKTGRDVHTFTFRFPEAGFGQKNIESAVAAANAEHHWVDITSARLFEALRDAPFFLNQPSPQPHYQLQTILAAEDAALSGLDVVLTGDGCDALFAAYPTINTRAATNRSLRSLPAFARRQMLSLCGLGVIDKRLGHVARMARSALRASLLDGVASQHLPSQYFDEVSLNRLRAGSEAISIETVEETRYRLAAEVAAEDLGAAAVLGNAATGQSQSKVEGGIARVGLPIVSPFTHPDFVKFVRSRPLTERRPSGSLRGAEGKPLLQLAAEESELLPASVIYQKKQAPTEAPIDAWYSGPLRKDVVDLLRFLPFEVEKRYVNSLLRTKFAENQYRKRVAISQHAFQVIGLLCSYAAFCRITNQSE